MFIPRCDRPSAVVEYAGYLSQVRTLAFLVGTDEDSYASTCSGTSSLGYDTGTNYETQLGVIQDDIVAQGSTISCYADSDSFCISAEILSTAEHYCIDSDESAKATDTACSDANTGCDGQSL